MRAGGHRAVESGRSDMPGLRYDPAERHIECSRRLKPAFQKKAGVYCIKEDMQKKTASVKLAATLCSRGRMAIRRYIPAHQLSLKVLSLLLLNGWVSLRNAFDSICLIRSRVTLNSFPISSRV